MAREQFQLPDGSTIPTELRGSWGDTTITIEASAGAKKRFKMLAYSGGMLHLKTHPHPVVADLAGMTIVAQKLPMHRDHNESLVVGQSDSVKITAKGIEATGEIDTTTSEGEIIAAAGRGGLDWEASIGAPVQAMEFYKPGETVTVNNKTFKGPVFVARKTTLQEISFVRRGADVGQTHVAIAAKSKEQDMTLEEIRAENLRCHEITAACGTNFPDIAAKAIGEGWAANDVKLHVLRASRVTEGPWIATGGRDAGTITPKHIAASLLVKAGQESTAEKAYGAGVLQASRHLHSESLLGLAKTCLRIDGREVPLGQNELIRAALSGGSLPIALSDAANKSLATAYRETRSTWEGFAAIRSAKDFKENYSLRPTWAGDIAEIPRGGSFAHGSIGEESIEWSIDTFGKMYSIDRRDVIDDDASLFSDIIPGLARSAKRGLNDLVWRTVMANSGSFFSSGNANLGTSSGALTAATLAARLTAMRSQTDANGSAIDIVPAVLVVPPALEFVAKNIINSSEIWRSTDGQPTGNSVQNAVTVEVEPRLSSSAYTGYSATAFYVFAGPMDMGFVVGYLNNAAMPTTESFGLDSDVNKLAYSWRVYHDFGAAYGDHRAAQKGDGL